MKNRIFQLAVAVSIVFVAGASIASEIAWSNKENTTNALRETVGLPSIAVGNLNPTARNPGLELLCTGFRDTPGGYCIYFTDGVPYINFSVTSNITVSGNR